MDQLMMDVKLSKMQDTLHMQGQMSRNIERNEDMQVGQTVEVNMPLVHDAKLIGESNQILTSYSFASQLQITFRHDFFKEQRLYGLALNLRPISEFHPFTIERDLSVDDTLERVNCAVPFIKNMLEKCD